MPIATRTFSDLDFNFAMHPVSSDVNVKYDEYAIKQSIKNLVMTRNFERPFHSEIGSQVANAMFEQIDPLTAEVLRRTILHTLIAHEPRVSVTNVDVALSPNNNSVYVKIGFVIVNTSTPLTVNLTLQRTR